MLKFLRKESIKKKIFWVIAVAVIATFFFSGIYFFNEDGSNDASTLGVVDGNKISLKDYLTSYRAVQHELFLRYGDQAGRMASVVNIKGEAWDRLLLLHQAKKEGLKTSDSEVVQWLLSQSAFLNQGKFNTKIYNYFVDNYLRISPRDFEEEIRGTLTLEKVGEKVRSKINISDKELQELYNQESGERDVLYAVLPWESEKDKVSVSEEEVEKIYPVLKDRLVDKDSKRALTFEEVKDDLKEMILKQKATQAAVKRLNDIRPKDPQADFEGALSKADIKVTSFEKFKKGSYLPGISSSEPVEKIVANLKEGEISLAFSVPDGAVIVKVVKDRPADDAQFQKDKETFRGTVLNKKFGEGMRALLESLRSKLKINLETMRQLSLGEEK